jgi:hypothetical protein
LQQKVTRTLGYKIEYSDDKVSAWGGFSVMKNFNDKIGLRTILRDLPILCSWSLDDQIGEW